LSVFLRLQAKGNCQIRGNEFKEMSKICSELLLMKDRAPIQFSDQTLKVSRKCSSRSCILLSNSIKRQLELIQSKFGLHYVVTSYHKIFRAKIAFEYPSGGAFRNTRQKPNQGLDL